MGTKTTWTEENLRLLKEAYTLAQGCTPPKSKTLRWAAAAEEFPEIFNKLNGDLKYIRSAASRLQPYFQGRCTEPGCNKKIYKDNLKCKEHCQAAVAENRSFRAIYGRNGRKTDRKYISHASGKSQLTAKYAKLDKGKNK